MRLHGRFAAGGETGELVVQLAGFPLLRDFIGVANAADLSAAYRAWDALQPSGTFDGSLEWSRDGDAWETLAPTDGLLDGRSASRG